MTRPLRLLFSSIALGALGSAAAAQQRDTVAPYVARGREVEAKQRELTARAQRLHDAFAETLRQFAPDLLSRLEPPPPIALGYGLLPHIVPDANPAATSTLQPVSYSWRWSETLMQREMEAIARLENAGTRARQTPSRALMDSIVTDYRAMLERKKLVDADVTYNWLWQGTIARSPAAFHDAMRLSDALMSKQRLAQSAAADSTKRAVAADSIRQLDALIERGLALDAKRILVPGFVRFSQDSGRWTVTVPMVTDIQDTTFLSSFRAAVEGNWRDSSHAVRIDWQRIAPESLYCSTHSSCRPPSRGEQIDLQAHIARFPPNVAVLTTGAGSTHVIGRAIVLSPHDAPARMVAHEFGHLLGFHDNYLRGFRDAGADGYVITELVVNPADIMGAYRTGRVSSAHFDRLMLAKEAPAIMTRGLEALYARHDAAAAAIEFERVLAIDPAHYGANYQMAVALDQSGQPERATERWRTVLEMALAIGDQQTAAIARKRLSP